MASSSLRIAEFDEAENLTATYVQSNSHAKGLSRVDIIPPEDSKSLWQKGLDVFLPVGYPNSVTHDYLEYQIYDSLQAFSSSIAGLLSSRAVLSSVGVGDSSASPTAALLLSIFQESIGRLATIFFAHRFGTALEPECKMYRLLADVLNDAGFLLDCLSPAFPKPMRVVVLSFSSVLRSLCGVAAGSAKASLSAHFARWGNLGELNAKDSSQETVISLLGMLAGSLVVTWVTTPWATWTALILLLSIHLETNRRAVRAVSMRSLNRQRAAIVFHHLQRGHVPTPVEVSRQERIFERDGVLRSASDEVTGHCTVGAPISRLLKAVVARDQQHTSSTNSLSLPNNDLDTILDIYKDTPYILWHDKPAQSRTGSRRWPSLFIVFKQGISAKEMLTAWWQALLLTNSSSSSSSSATKQYDGTDLMMVSASRTTKAMAQTLLGKYEKQLEEQGWDLTASALETTAGSRVSISSS